MEAYFQALSTLSKIIGHGFFFMAEFAYNNAQNDSIGHISLNFNYKYHPYISYKENLDLRSKSKIVKKLFFELQNLIAICQQNLHYVQKF